MSKALDELSEHDVDGKIVKFAKQLKCLVIKLTTLAGHGESGWPDRLFLRKSIIVCPHCEGRIQVAKAVFMEMKAPGKKSTPIQARHQQLLAAEGFPTYSDIDNPNVGKQILQAEFGNE